MTSTFKHLRASVVTHAGTESTSKVIWFKKEWKQTDEQADGRSRLHYLSVNEIGSKQSKRLAQMGFKDHRRATNDLWAGARRCTDAE